MAVRQDQAVGATTNPEPEPAVALPRRTAIWTTAGPARSTAPITAVE